MNTTGTQADVKIIGGGIAGLWIARRLITEGFRVVLVSQGPLGAGQTIASQGIIHGGVKYALTGEASNASRAIAEMPAIWNSCLRGEGEIDLRAARVLSTHQLLWTTGGIGAKLVGIAASKAIRTPVRKLSDSERSAAFSTAPLPRSVDVYRVDETVLDPHSLVSTLSQGVHVVQPHQIAEASLTVWCAGAGNPAEMMQTRPLHMVILRGTDLPMIFGHAIAGQLTDKPRATITSQHDRAGRTVWYVGGAIAEDGVRRSRDEQIEAARRELHACVGWIDTQGTQWATLRVDRAEARTTGGIRPDMPVLRTINDHTIAAWPTKLAFAPLLGSMVVDWVRNHAKPTSAHAFLPETGSCPIAPLPWEQEELQWS